MKINHMALSLCVVCPEDPPWPVSLGSVMVKIWSLRGLFVVSGRQSSRKPHSKARLPNTANGKTSRDPLL